ncbi:MAG: glycogen debranching protein GlgX [Verrucomicrobiales bacterium]|nr:glycogen debranching protein GlgX [Verrucomicrobiales bacterium]
MPSSSLSITEGRPSPLGSTRSYGGNVNFAVVAPRADAVDLCLFWNDMEPGEESARVRMTGNSFGVWHVAIEGLPDRCRYGYRVQGPWKPEEGLFFNHHKLLLDPYAKLIDGKSLHHNSMRCRRSDGRMDKTDSGPFAPRGVIVDPYPFDWEDTRRPNIPMTDCVFYEAHIKGFSYLNPELPEDLRGTYAGLAHESSIQYLKELGITSVQLLPVHQHLDDGFLLDRGLINYWGYNTLGFFAPEYRFSATNDPITEFKEMVRTFHREGMEVILDVVYNHTCETGVDGPTCLFRGFDNAAYYRTMSGDPATYDDVTGCGNSVDISQRDAMKLVLDSLRYWVTEMGVDGFRFDLAATLGRDSKEFTNDAAFFRAVHQDPILSEVKMIAEPWDIGLGGYQQGNFPVIWKELNGKYRDCVRQFWRGDPLVVGEFATRVTGSADLFAHNGRSPESSLNMITSHDGFTLHDLVSYNQKHNEANGELNRDGDSHNISYNHGVEGSTDDPVVNEMRKRQIRNFLTTLICSQGVPFITAGDERLRTQQGNNNGYCQDSELSWINWDRDDPEAEAMYRFVRRLIAFRRENPSLRKSRFFTGNKMNNTGLADVSWLNIRGRIKENADWSVEKSGAFGMMIHREASFRRKPLSGFILFFFNARQEEVKFHFPEKPNFRWECIIDTLDAEGKPTLETAKPGQKVHVSARSMQIWRELG